MAPLGNFPEYSSLSHTRMRTHTHTRMHTHARMHTHEHTHARTHAHTHTRTHKHCFLATLELLSTIPQGHRGRCWVSHPPYCTGSWSPHTTRAGCYPSSCGTDISLIHYPVSSVRKRGHRGVKECSGRTELGFRPRQSGLRVCAGNYYTPPPRWMDETFSPAGLE